jgi:intracellular septation protein
MFFYYVNICQVNKSFLKFATDFGPLAIFFFYYYNNDKNLSVAIPPLIVATLIALAAVWFFEKRIPMMPLISGVLITFFGLLTIITDDMRFIYMKPTIINILFALALFFGKYFTNEPILKKLMGKSITLTDMGWELLNRRWMIFFLGLALLNECIWRTQTEEFWVNFKVWGMLPITLVFTIFQISLINKHKIDE